MYLLLIIIWITVSFCAWLFCRKAGPIVISHIEVTYLMFALIFSFFAFYEVSLLNCDPWINFEMFPTTIEMKTEDFLLPSEIVLYVDKANWSNIGGDDLLLEMLDNLENCWTSDISISCKSETR